MTTKRNALLAVGLLTGALATGAVWAHGNVVPQAVETQGLTPIKDAGVSLDGDGWAAVNPYRTSPERDKAVEIGASAYNQNCAACHGLEAKSGGIAPDLRMLDAGEAGDEWFVERVRHGAVRDGRVYMPKMADYLSQEALWAVRTYLDSVRVEE
ncbi:MULTISPECIES: cytochrome c-550 PedF [Pseudomonas]|uniref:Cytochrome c-550 PedF n=1 Tax=Pseudomonas protegens TaxID=380021 RepID=A0A9Q6I9T5_9PSED|nr:MULTISPECIES: cytochrome c-550 PedF [Pseudomonas]MBS7561695.1 cytochrome c-550 PedF [Pseudomonas sp. RC4D1]MCO7574135.1 cytochrome c-550 PedF [Pseudomonas chlororaphis]MCO7591779.1 cytochrome c-550 PedF [Pseudomonas chlororaphis]MDC7818914.1 cytochrome c-550 PedF [Pseudomonas sp. BLCC-B112]MDP4567991.1 cytochrome c-550 PedF [Pseudomonas sp. LPH60]